MKKFLIFYLIFKSTLLFANERGACPSYESEYGKDTFYDLTNTPILAAIKDDLESSNLLGNMENKSFYNQNDKIITYQNGNILLSVPYSNGVKNGIEKTFYQNQNIFATIPYKNGQINGIATIYYIDGNLKMKQEYKNGSKIGQGYMYHPNGNILLTQSYKDGKINGIQKRYYSNNTLESIIPYNNGIIDGKVNLYYNNGDILASLTFKNGNLIQNICYTKENKLSKLNDIALFKLKYGMRPIECFSISEGFSY